MTSTSSGKSSALPFSARVIPSLKGIKASAWDACIAGDPLTSYAFLSALEDSGSAVPQTGWAASHILLEDEAEQLLGVLPVWFKSHSQGEYIFDHAFADALMRAGGEYYPKLLSAVPFTPVTGRRLLVREDAPPHARVLLLKAMLALCKEAGVSSAHINFLTGEEAILAEQADMIKRTGCQFIWRNKGYQSFDEFLCALSSRHRKSVRRERRQVAESGLVIKHLSGKDITEAAWDVFWEFYQDTGARKWGSPYLTRTCFSLLGERMGENLLLMLALDEGTPIAGALHIIGEDALCGRYWGAAGHYPFLHFELCYYQAIEFAIAKGLERVEAGAQGGHKIERGYAPEPVWSVHHFAHSGLANAAREYLADEDKAMRREIGALDTYTPFRKGAG